MDLIESALAPSLDTESNKTLVSRNKSHQGMIPPPLITLDSPGNVDEPHAVIDAGAKATAANLPHVLH